MEINRELRLTPAVAEWMTTLPADTLARVTAAMNRVQKGGPALGRPEVDRIRGSRHHKMKELRIGSSVRVLFVFDGREALMLTGGDKRGVWNGWYPRKIREADRLYDQHQGDNGKGGWSRHRDPPSHGR